MCARHSDIQFNFFFFQAEDGIRDYKVTGVQTCALPISGQWRDPVDLWPLWSAIACPTLIVRGAESDVLAPETAKRMLATNPHARLVEVPGAGHTVPGEQPAAFQRLLTEFLGA